MRWRRHLNSNSHAAGEQARWWRFARHTATLFNGIDFSSFQNKFEHTVIASGVISQPPLWQKEKEKSHLSDVLLCLNTREERQVIRYYSCHESFFFFILLFFESWHGVNAPSFFLFFFFCKKARCLTAFPDVCLGKRLLGLIERRLERRKMWPTTEGSAASIPAPLALIIARLTLSAFVPVFVGGKQRQAVQERRAAP